MAETDWFLEGISLGADVVDKFEDQTDLVESMRFVGLPPVGSAGEAALIDGFMRRMRRFVTEGLDSAPAEARTGEPLV